MNYDALAYRRFRWSGVPEQIGDVERILTWWTGTSVLVEDANVEGGLRLCPVMTRLTMQEPFRPVYLAPDGGPVDASGLYHWDAIIDVAPARQIIAHLQAVEMEIDRSEVAQSVLARMRLMLRTRRKNAADVESLKNGIYAGCIPTLEVSSELSPDDLSPIGDGETHAASLNDMHTVALARACQQLGVYYDPVVKRERVVTGELGSSLDAVDVIRQNEIDQRRKLADWTGWGLEVRI